MVPEGWNYVSLAKIMEFKNGLNFTKSDQGEAIKIVGVSDFKNYSELRSTENLAVINVAQKIRSNELLANGDLLFVRSNGNKDLIGRCLFFPKVVERIAYSGFTIRGRVNKAFALPEYLSNVARSPIMKQQISRNGGGTNISNLSQQILGDVSIPLPPFPEQKKIAQILSTWDQAITATERLLENSQQRKKGLMQQLLTGKKRLPGFEGEWKEGHLGDIATIDSGFAFKSNVFSDDEGAVPIIRMSDFKSGGLDTKNAARIPTDEVIGLERFALRSKDFVFGMSGSLSNYAWIRSSDLPCYLNQRVGRIRAKKPANQLFVTYLYLSDRIQQDILDKAAGAAQLNVSVKDLREIRITYPKKDEQDEIAQILSIANQDVSALGASLNCLKQEKKALMQQLLTGKRRVKVEANAA